jgi:hypothetical protein
MKEAKGIGLSFDTVAEVVKAVDRGVKRCCFRF